MRVLQEHSHGKRHFPCQQKGAKSRLSGICDQFFRLRNGCIQIHRFVDDVQNQVDACRIDWAEVIIAAAYHLR